MIQREGMDIVSVPIVAADDLLLGGSWPQPIDVQMPGGIVQGPIEIVFIIWRINTATPAARTIRCIDDQVRRIHIRIGTPVIHGTRIGYRAIATDVGESSVPDLDIGLIEGDGRQIAALKRIVSDLGDRGHA